MLIRWLLATLHLLPLGLGLGAVLWRAINLAGPLDNAGLRRVFFADTLWGIAAVLWIVTGLMRAFGGYEKGTDYYIHNGAFLLKMALLIAILALEIWPMITLIKWRIHQGRNTLTDTSAASAMSRVSWIQTGLVIAMIFAATAMARGYGANIW